MTSGPFYARNFLGESHTVWAKTFVNRLASQGQIVHFQIVEGPHAGHSGADTTAENGRAEFTYTGEQVGHDIIEIRWVDPFGETHTCTATKSWMARPEEAH